jgi:hypothetical protein
MVRQACPEPAEGLTVMVRPDHHGGKKYPLILSLSKAEHSKNRIREVPSPPLSTLPLVHPRCLAPLLER